MEIKQAIIKNNFHFNKKYGQNFIENRSLLCKIADCADIQKTDTVLEIGVGAGTLTRVLSERAKRVVGYEIDKNLAPVLSETLAGVNNAEVVFRDFMNESIDEANKIIGGEFIVVANLPYYITSPVTMRILEEYPNCKRLVIMVQKEVADRFTAECGTKNYGSITAAIDYYCDAKYMFTVTRENFYPVPNVDSAVVRMECVSKYAPLSERAFKDTLRVAFTLRRKTLVNNLMRTLSMSRTQSEEVLSELGYDLNIRGEVLSTQDFVNLSDILYKKNILK